MQSCGVECTLSSTKLTSSKVAAGSKRILYYPVTLLSGYTGEVGEVIRAKVADDVQVEAVSVVITTDTDVLVEQGQMTREQGLWYTYTTTADCPPGPARVVVTGLDLPGHVGTNEATLTAV